MQGIVADNYLLLPLLWDGTPTGGKFVCVDMYVHVFSVPGQ